MEIQDAVRKPIAVNTKRMGGAFHPFEREKVAAKPASVAEAPSSSMTENTNGGGGGSSEEKVDKEKEGHSSQRKARRCWSPELHRRFLHALQQLGGSHGVLDEIDFIPCFSYRGFYWLLKVSACDVNLQQRHRSILGS